MMKYNLFSLCYSWQFFKLTGKPSFLPIYIIAFAFLSSNIANLMQVGIFAISTIPAMENSFIQDN